MYLTERRGRFFLTGTRENEVEFGNLVTTLDKRSSFHEWPIPPEILVNWHGEPCSNQGRNEMRSNPEDVTACEPDFSWCDDRVPVGTIIVGGNSHIHLPVEEMARFLPGGCAFTNIDKAWGFPGAILGFETKSKPFSMQELKKNKAKGGAIAWDMWNNNKKIFARTFAYDEDSGCVTDKLKTGWVRSGSDKLDWDSFSDEKMRDQFVKFVEMQLVHAKALQEKMFDDFTKDIEVVLPPPQEMLYDDPTLKPIYDVGRVHYVQQALPNLDQRCVQCCGEPDGRELLLTPKSGGEPILLHEQCWEFYRP